jgi:hypothetical protein
MAQSAKTRDGGSLEGSRWRQPPVWSFYLEPVPKAIVSGGRLFGGGLVVSWRLCGSRFEALLSGSDSCSPLWRGFLSLLSAFTDMALAALCR